MIEQELILLGLLRESPKHGYEIKTKIREILSLFAGVDLKSIYYPLTVLEKRGMVSKHKAKEGKRPVRFVYSLTPKGESHFNALLGRSFLDLKRPVFSLDLSLYFLRYIKPSIARRRLLGRMQILKKLLNSLRQMAVSLKGKKEDPLACILEHNLNMLKAEYEFLSGFIKTL